MARNGESGRMMRYGKGASAGLRGNFFFARSKALPAVGRSGDADRSDTLAGVQPGCILIMASKQAAQPRGILKRTGEGPMDKEFQWDEKNLDQNEVRPCAARFTSPFLRSPPALLAFAAARKGSPDEN